MKWAKPLVALAVAALLAAAYLWLRPEPVVVYRGGPILTLDADNRVVEALAVRGDRIGADPFDEQAAFMTFNGAFSSLLGRTVPLAGDEMQRFADFTFELTTPPNPIRNLDNSLTPAQQAGRDEFFSDRCPGCHVLSSDDGFFGTAGFFDGNSLDPTDLDAPQTRKVADLRGLYEKVGFYNVPSRSCGEPCLAAGGTIEECVDLCFEQPQIRGFGSGFDGATAAIGEIGSGTIGEFDFLFAGPSELAPIVGQQATLTATSGLDVLSRAELLRQRAAAGECDLVAKAPVDATERGWLFDGDGFTSDVTRDPGVSFDALVARSAAADFELTLTCLPPGAGRRAIDRDADGSLDGDERAAQSAIDDAAEVALESARVRVRRNALPAGDERWLVTGRAVLPDGGFPALDVTGATVTISQDGAEVAVFDLAPGGAWTAGGRRARFRSGGLRAGVRRIGDRLAIKVEQRGGPRFVRAGDTVDVHVDLDGRRAKRRFAFEVAVGCRERDNGDLSCR